MRVVVLLLAVLGACGGTSGPPPAPVVVDVSPVATRAGEDDVIVAQVNGRPVWGSCVAAQVTRGAKDAKAGLDECIAFELLAQEAEKRGLAANQEVHDATRTAMVNQLIARDFEDKYKSPADLKEQIDKAIARNAHRMHRPELRASSYFRFNAGRSASAEVDAKAHALADQLAAELAPQRGLTPAHLNEAGTRIAATSDVPTKYEDVPIAPREGSRYEQAYMEAVFSVPELGRVSAPARTSWGWDVVLWTDVVPAAERTREELASEAFPDLRRAYYQVWVNQIMKERGVKVAIDEREFAKLDEGAP